MINVREIMELPLSKIGPYIEKRRDEITLGDIITLIKYSIQLISDKEIGV